MTVSNGDVLVQCFVPGAPKTKGSLDFVPGGRCRCSAKCQGYLAGGHVKEGVIGSNLWRRKMTEIIRNSATTAGVAAGECTVIVVYYLPVKWCGAVRAGDLDKLLRNTLDSLQDAGIVDDDTRVVKVVAEKTEANEIFQQGMSLLVLGGRV